MYNLLIVSLDVMVFLAPHFSLFISKVEMDFAPFFVKAKIIAFLCKFTNTSISFPLQFGYAYLISHSAYLFPIIRSFSLDT